ncbi:MAG: hypothetical protein WBA89_29805 [Microcoleus sp.]|uniref:hypothetical protein n=1 Tax=Microcoleus sp. TaxID=44472 RepID=UPI003C77E98A
MRENIRLTYHPKFRRGFFEIRSNPLFIGIVNSSQQSTVNSQQSTVNSQQSTVNSQQSTVNSQQSTSPDGVTGNDISLKIDRFLLNCLYCRKNIFFQFDRSRSIEIELPNRKLKQIFAVVKYLNL